MRVVRAGYDQLIRAPTKTITFTGASGLGLAGVAVPVWTLSGRVLLHYMTAFVSTAVVSTADAGTISLGTASITNKLITATTVGAGTFVANEWWAAGVSTAGILQDIVNYSFLSASCSESIIITPLTQNITSGVLVFDCWYRSLTAGGSLS